MQNEEKTNEVYYCINCTKIVESNNGICFGQGHKVTYCSSTNEGIAYTFKVMKHECIKLLKDKVNDSLNQQLENCETEYIELYNNIKSVNNPFKKADRFALFTDECLKEINDVRENLESRVNKALNKLDGILENNEHPTIKSLMTKVSSLTHSAYKFTDKPASAYIVPNKKKEEKPKSPVKQKKEELKVPTISKLHQSCVMPVINSEVAEEEIIKQDDRLLHFITPRVLTIVKHNDIQEAIINNDHIDKFSESISFGKNSIYIIGGNNSNSTYLYDNTKPTYGLTLKKGMSMPKYYHSLCILRNDIVCIGGSNYTNGILKKCEKYNIKHDRWDNLPDLVNARRRASVFSSSSCVYAIFGENHNTKFNSMEKYIAGSNKWEEIESKLSEDLDFSQFEKILWPNERCAAGAIMINEKQALIFGGISQDRETDECYIYSTDTKLWSEAKPLPNKAQFCCNCAPIIHGQILYAFDTMKRQLIIDVSSKLEDLG